MSAELCSCVAFCNQECNFFRRNQSQDVFWEEVGGCYSQAVWCTRSQVWTVYFKEWPCLSYILWPQSGSQLPTADGKLPYLFARVAYAICIVVKYAIINHLIHGSFYHAEQQITFFCSKNHEVCLLFMHAGQSDMTCCSPAGGCGWSALGVQAKRCPVQLSLWGALHCPAYGHHSSHQTGKLVIWFSISMVKDCVSGNVHLLACLTNNRS